MMPGDIESTDPFPNGVRKIYELDGNALARFQFPTRSGESLLIPELQDYMLYNSDFPRAQLAPYRTNLADRWALPLSCLIVVLVAATARNLVSHNRRGVLAGVA